MSKFSPNNPCPCGSNIKYKKCCEVYHKGARAKNALLLMKSRYSAFATSNSRYLIKTTHRDNIDYKENKKEWLKELDIHCKEVDFLSLKIIDFIDGKDEAYVTFRAELSTGDLVEKSRFLKVNKEWFYASGDI